MPPQTFEPMEVDLTSDTDEPMDVEYVCMEDYDDKIHGFPPEYSFLLKLDAINDQELRQHPVRCTFL